MVQFLLKLIEIEFLLCATISVDCQLLQNC